MSHAVPQFPRSGVDTTPHKHWWPGLPKKTQQNAPITLTTVIGWRAFETEMSMTTFGVETRLLLHTHKQSNALFISDKLTMNKLQQHSPFSVHFYLCLCTSQADRHLPLVSCGAKPTLLAKISPWSWDIKLLISVLSQTKCSMS